MASHITVCVCVVVDAGAGVYLSFALGHGVFAVLNLC